MPTWRTFESSMWIVSMSGPRRDDVVVEECLKVRRERADLAWRGAHPEALDAHAGGVHLDQVRVAALGLESGRHEPQRGVHEVRRDLAGALGGGERLCGRG